MKKVKRVITKIFLKKGSALIFAMITLTAMMIVAIASYEASMVNQRTATDTEKSVSSFQAADSGIELTMKKITTDPTQTITAAFGSALSGCGTPTPNDLTYKANFSGRDIEVQFYSDPDSTAIIDDCSALLSSIQSIKSLGKYGGTVRAVNVVVESDSSCPTGVDIDDKTVSSIKYKAIITTNGKCWLDRNLGATRVATFSNDSQAYGWYFQWGRGADGHQINISSTTTTVSTSSNVGHGNFIIKGTGSPYYDWLNVRDGSLWDGIGVQNNPCPLGFRIPTIEEWEDYFTGEGFLSCTSDCVNKAFNSKLKLITSGARYYDDALMVDQGVDGLYWSSTPDIPNGMTYNVKFQTTSLRTTWSYWRSAGFPVRCIKD